MVLEVSLADTINITVLGTRGHRILDEFIKILLGVSLEPGGQAQITYENIHKGWSILLWYFLDATQCAYEIERGVDMEAIEGNH